MASDVSDVDEYGTIYHVSGNSFQFNTTATNGSNERVSLHFIDDTSSGNVFSSLDIYFINTSFQLAGCHKAVMQNTITASGNKTWNITLTGNSFTIECNGNLAQKIPFDGAGANDFEDCVQKMLGRLLAAIRVNFVDSATIAVKTNSTGSKCIDFNNFL